MNLKYIKTEKYTFELINIFHYSMFNIVNNIGNQPTGKKYSELKCSFKAKSFDKDIISYLNFNVVIC